MTIVIPDEIVIPQEGINLVLIILVSIAFGFIMGWMRGYWSGHEAAIEENE